MADTICMATKKDHDAIQEAIKNLAKVTGTGYEDSKKGGRKFALAMQLAIAATFQDAVLSGDDDVLETLTLKLMNLRACMRALRAPSVTSCNT
jgi:hypothetical protein